MIESIFLMGSILILNFACFLLYLRGNSQDKTIRDLLKRQSNFEIKVNTTMGAAFIRLDEKFKSEDLRKLSDELDQELNARREGMEK